MYSSLSNASNYSYAQTYANDTATVQQPQGLSNCLTDLLQDYQKISDMFTSGFSIAFAIQGFAQMATKNIINGLENKVCSKIQAAAQGIFGGFHKDFTLLNGAAVISIDATVTGDPSNENGATPPPIPAPTVPDYPMPVQTPSAPIVVPAPPTAPGPKPPGTSPTSPTSPSSSG